MSGFVLKGALVEFMPTFLPIPLPNVIVFQYNPETMTHTWTQPEPAPTAGTETSNPLAVKGDAGRGVLLHDRDGRERRDRRRERADGSARRGERDLQPARCAGDAALPDRRGPDRADRCGVGGRRVRPQRDQTSGTTRTVPQSVMPVTLFIWGPGRIVPVRVTGLTITEKLYDTTAQPHPRRGPALAPGAHPRRAYRRASTDNDVLGNLASIAYNYTLSLRQATRGRTTSRTRRSRSSG